MSFRNWIQVHRKTEFDFNDLDNNDYSVEAIAYSIAGQCRYLAHLDNHAHYSTAQHSVLVSRVVPSEYAFEGLCHDLLEAFVGDPPSTLKPMLGDYVKIEKAVESRVRLLLYLPEVISPMVMETDVRICLNESNDLMGGFVNDVPAHKYDPIPDLTITPWERVKAYNTFMKRFKELFQYHVIHVNNNWAGSRFEKIGMSRPSIRDLGKILHGRKAK